MNKQSNIQDKISEVEKGCGSKEYCFICEKYNCNCESSECFKTCGNSENVFGRIELCPVCQAKRQIWKEAQEIINEREKEIMEIIDNRVESAGYYIAGKYDEERTQIIIDELQELKQALKSEDKK